MDDTRSNADGLRCDCGSERICISYSAPVFAYIDRGAVTKVVVDDEDAQFGGVARCLVCERFWVLDEEPEVGVWPAWHLGH